MMHILHSNWLIQMLKKAGNTPQERMLCLFDILNDWSEAPGLDTHPEQEINTGDATLLKTYLSLEAAKARAALPEMLATQLYVMAQSAMHEKLLGYHPAGLAHAKSAAAALITAQTKKEFHLSRISAYAIAASFLGAMVIMGSLFLLNQPKNVDFAQLDSVPDIMVEPLFTNTTIASPQSTASLVAQIEQMRSGNCRLLEAILLPEQYKSVYFKNIVLGQISTNVDEQKVVRELLDKIHCNYTPMLMKKST
jgi:hypothetical protein